MVFKHKQTDKDAVRISVDRKSEDALEIKEPTDLPPISFWETHFKMPPEILFRGLTKLKWYLGSFLEEDTSKGFYLWFIPSGFPDGVLPRIDK